MKYWFVNLGKYYKIQREGRFLCAPIYNKKGNTLSHWDSLMDVNKGDIIICNNGGIVSVGVAKDHAYLSNIPAEFEDSYSEKGRRIDLKFIDLDTPLNYLKYRDYISQNINQKKNPFNINGHAKLGYLFPFDENIAVFLLKEMNNKEIEKLLEINDIEIKYEIEEIKEEQEQFEKINNGSVKGYNIDEIRKIENKEYNYVQKIEEGKSRVLREPTDPKLKATRMEIAEYLCEINPNHKTFRNAAGNFQYLECHHIIPMNAQKDFENVKLDSLFNIIAICPICHMQVHYAASEDKGQIFAKMYEIRKKEMIERGFDLAKINEIFNKYYLNNKS